LDAVKSSSMGRPGWKIAGLSQVKMHGLSVHISTFLETIIGRGEEEGMMVRVEGQELVRVHKPLSITYEATPVPVTLSCKL